MEFTQLLLELELLELLELLQCELWRRNSVQD